MQADRFPPVAVLAASIVAALGAPAPCRANMIGVDGVTCLLSDAIVAANTDLPAGGCITGNGDDSIAIFGNQTLNAELPVVTSNIAFFGGLGQTSIFGDGTHRLFFIGAPGFAPTVSFSDLTLSGGKASGGTGMDGGGGGAGLGGALFIYDGSVSVGNTIFVSNSATGGNSSGTPILFGFNNWTGSGGGGGGGMGGDGGSAAGPSGINGGQGASQAFGGGGGGGGRGDTQFGGDGGNGGGGGFGGSGGAGGSSATAGGAGEYGGGGGGGGAGTTPLMPSQSGGSGGFGSGGGGGGGQCFTGGGGSCGSAAGPGGSGGFGGGGGASGSFVSQPPANGGVGGFGGGGGCNGKGEGGGTSAAGGFGAGNASINEAGGGGAGFGGALFIRSGSLDVHNSTFQQNAAAGGTSNANAGFGKGGAIAALTVLDNGNGDNQGMPSALPKVTGCANTFSGDSASNAAGLARDNDDTFAADRPGLLLACNDRIFADGFGVP